MNKVQEALTAAIELIQCFEAKLSNSQTAHSLPSEKVKRKLRDAISEIGKCEPDYYAIMADNRILETFDNKDDAENTIDTLLSMGRDFQLLKLLDFTHHQ